MTTDFLEALEMAHELIQEAKGAEGDQSYVINHLDDAENWLRKAAEAHDRRVTELLTYNNEQVERRRAIRVERDAFRTDAERWRALTTGGRIRMFGSANVDPKTGERPDGDSNWVHFGAEFWSTYPQYEETEETRLWAKNALTAVADDIIRREETQRGQG